ncbi:iron-only hydrogenase system regulator [Romboutsia ilealis]|uniref:Iron-only hydrogenase system regulator n=1 Tax=Romboutsia faecis TaxID=2764597 RepID=A0ABR7JQU1_9FIRM|nr:TM1266 family iron-only hydrogenase system putative regulator [Romboutsia faecis]MBC5997275.1 iron-only hydrogenase system regulator [Romboutsia faecis]MRN23557.1 iron-only hydrogenase system regulator [Romboutsia ilealis]
METRIALIGIIIEDKVAIPKLNETIHKYEQYIVGRMGIPYREKGISIISIIIDASNDVINSLSGKLGMIKGINVKINYSKINK